MEVISLQSGSNGNCIYVAAGGVRLLIDAGISGKRAAERLAACGRDIESVDAVLISHDHTDHARNAGVFHRKFSLPVYATPATLTTAEAKLSLGPIDDVRHFHTGDVLDFGAVQVQTVPTPHDGADACGFVVSDGRCRVGILTDLGHTFAGLADLIATLDAVLIESNYDPDMLAWGPYPPSVQARIRGAGGHISNGESAELLHQTGTDHLAWACLGHLSQHNNTPDLAMETHRAILGPAAPLHVASRYGPVALPVL